MSIDHRLEKLEKPGVHRDWSDFKAILVTVSRFVLVKSNIQLTADRSNIGAYILLKMPVEWGRANERKVQVDFESTSEKGAWIRIGCAVLLASGKPREPRI